MKLPWMGGNERTETKRGQTAQCRVGCGEARVSRQVQGQGKCEDVNALLAVNFQWFDRPRLGNCECFTGRGKGTWGSDYKVPSTMLEHLDLILKAMATLLRILISGET